MKDFDELVRGLKREEFKLNGQKFKIRSKIHARRFARMIEMVENIEGYENSIDGAVEFMNIVLLGPDRERFRALLAVSDEDEDTDDDNAVTIEQVNALLKWLVEHYTGKQPTRDEQSTPGSESTQTPLNVVSFQPAKTQAS
jgi:hypothetical protein